MKTQIALIGALLVGCATDADLGTTASEIVIIGGSLFALQDGVCTPAGDVVQCSPHRADPPSEFVLKGSNFTIEGLADPPDPDLPPDPDVPPDPGHAALTFVVKNAAGAIVFDSRRVR